MIGRNQNPWVEVNMALLRNNPLQVDLVRRRSGGGTVFHDRGNVNYSVICPTNLFNRDKHAEMVVRALHDLGLITAKVNERHDIVLGSDGEGSTPLKVSGSAYKLTRLRSLHHGTCLLNSPNIGRIGSFLKSPAKPFIKARGVDSVSSPITNVGIENSKFEQSVVTQFLRLHPGGRELTMVHEDDAMGVPDIKKGFDELTSPDWIYGQTPQFTFSTYTTEEDCRVRPALASDLEGLRANFTARNGIITQAEFELGDKSQQEDGKVSESLINKKLHEIQSWTSFLPSLKIGQSMDRLFGMGVSAVGEIDREPNSRNRIGIRV